MPHAEQPDLWDPSKIPLHGVKKIFVLDTNVLLHDPHAIFEFADNDVIIPIYVVEEIDTFKREANELGRAARAISRNLDNLRQTGPLNKGVPLPGGGKLRVMFTGKTMPQSLDHRKEMDDKILAVALLVQTQETRTPVIFVTQDTNMRIRADALGLMAVNYLKGRVDINELYTGWREAYVAGELVDRFFEKGQLPQEDLGPLNPPLSANEYVHLIDQGSHKHSALARTDKTRHTVEAMPKGREAWGIRPRNREQSFAFDLLLNDEIKLVTLVGKAGTGKTLLAIAAGLRKVADDNVYHKLLVTRPIFPLGRDLGYLPGTVEEKLNPWMKPIFDNMELIMGASRETRGGARNYSELMNQGLLEIEALTYIRGRSIPNQFLIVDEAQNLTPHEVKTILTRAGDNTKVVFTGDPYQIDNPYMDSSNNGLTILVNRFRGESMAGHCTLVRGERSPLAELAANLL
ncbi:MAG: hypothetical protein GMKNLPBB_02329 [Myxococcota bacterium]|nr:hypothetical protein [Myxococcota bacterium]